MTYRVYFPIVVSIVMAIGLIGCYPSKIATTIPIETVAEKPIDIPSKIVLHNACTAIFPKGFRVARDTIYGRGELFTLTGQHQYAQDLKIALGDVAAMTKYELKSSTGSVLGSFFHGILGVGMTGLSVYCLACPKCCFGSCPTIYTYDGSKYNLEAELFSHCISKQLEDDDIDFFSESVPADRIYKLRMTNEALETHYLNSFRVYAAYHPSGTVLYPYNDGNIAMVRKSVAPSQVINRAGKVVLGFVRDADALSYRSSEEAVVGMVKQDSQDWLDVECPVPNGADEIIMVVRMRNTLLSTVLLYDLVLGSQGLDAMNWTERMDTDGAYASQFRRIYKSFSGIAVKVLRNGQWVQQSVIADAGPLTWKSVAVRIPMDHSQSKSDGISVRLQFVPDNVMIDKIEFEIDGHSDARLIVEELKPVEIRDNAGNMRYDVLEPLATNNDQYLVTSPGESYRMVYHVPEKAGFETRMFVRSKGYYREWIRGSWTRAEQKDYRFNLFEIDKTITYLGRRWLQDKNEIEARFFEARIPIKEVQ